MEPNKSYPTSDDEEVKPLLDMGDDNKDDDDDDDDLVQPIRRDRFKQRRNEEISEIKKMKNELIVFDKHGNPMSKLEKKKPEITVLDDFFRRSGLTGSEKIYDFDGADGLWGMLYARHFDVSEWTTNSETPYNVEGSQIVKTVNANSIVPPEFAPNTEAEADFDIVFMTHDWGENYPLLIAKLDKGMQILNENGKIILVSHKKKGIDSIVERLVADGIGASVVEKGAGGVRIVEISKQNSRINPEMTDTKKEIQFAFNGTEYSAITESGIFSKENLDTGTQHLLEYVIDNFQLDEMNVLDIGSGWGAIEIVLSDHFKLATMEGLEINERAVELSRLNNPNPAIFKFDEVDVTKRQVELTENQAGSFDFIISNPPFHVTEEQRLILFENARKLLRKGGYMAFVVEDGFHDAFLNTASRKMNVVKDEKKGQYNIVVLRK